MNRKGFIVWILLLTASIWAQAQGTFVIEGQVKNLKQGVRLELYRMEGGVGNVIAVDTLRGDTFRFEQPALGQEIDRVGLMIIDGNVFNIGLDLWVKAGTHIRLKGEDMNIYTWKVENDNPLQKTRQLFVDDSYDLWNLIQETRMDYMRLRRTYEKKELTEEEKAWVLPLRDSLERKEDELIIRISANDIARMKQLPIDEVWMQKLMDLAVSVKSTKNFPYRKEVELLYNMLSDEQRQTQQVMDIEAYLAPPESVSLAEKAADGDLFDLQGQVHHLSDFKGKPVLIDFWSRGCGPCLMALPEMEEISKEYEGRLILVSLSIDDKTGWEIASRHHKITWWNLNDLKGQHGIYAKYTSGSIPRYVFLSPEGEVVEMWSGYGKGSLKLKMQELLNTEKKGDKL